MLPKSPLRLSTVAATAALFAGLAGFPFATAVRATSPVPSSYDDNGDTALGFNALPDLSGGVANTAVGYQVLNQNTTGTFNTATGTVALAGNTTGSYNSVHGAEVILPRF